MAARYLTLANNDSDEPLGWFDPKGNFYPCGHTQHSDTMYNIMDHGYPEDVQKFESEFVKVTKLWGNPGATLLLTYAKKIPARQKLAIEKHILKHDLIADGEWLHLTSSIVIVREGDRLKFVTR